MSEDDSRQGDREEDRNWTRRQTITGLVVGVAGSAGLFVGLSSPESKPRSSDEDMQSSARDSEIMQNNGGPVFEALTIGYNVRNVEAGQWNEYTEPVDNTSESGLNVILIVRDVQFEQIDISITVTLYYEDNERIMAAKNRHVDSQMGGGQGTVKTIGVEQETARAALAIEEPANSGQAETTTDSGFETTTRTDQGETTGTRERTRTTGQMETTTRVQTETPEQRNPRISWAPRFSTAGWPRGQYSAIVTATDLQSKQSTVKATSFSVE